MADGKVKIVIEVDGKQVNIASDELDKLGKSGHESGKGISEAEKGMGKAGVSAKQLAISLGLVKIASAAFNVLKQSLDSAISRFDTLNKFPKVLQSLGVSAEDSQASISKLSDGIDGLPTKLDDIAANAQRMYISFKDMDKATDSALALNNAFLASGSSGEAAASGTEQYIQALQKGKPDMMEWRNMQQNMSIALERVAEQYGMTTNELGEALRSGEISMDSFNDKLIELGTGTGELAELARTNSMGLATSFENLKNAAARGMADLVDSFNKLSVAITGKEIAENIDSLKVIVNSSFKAMGSAIEATAPLFIFFTDIVKGTIPVVEALTPAILGLVAAYAAYTVITKASAAIQASNAILKVAQASKTGLTLVTKAHTIALAADMKMEQASAAAMIANSGAITLKQIAIGVLTGQMTLLAGAQTIAAAASAKFGAVMAALAGPVGWVVAGIGLLTAATIAIVKHFKQASEEADRLNAENEALGESTNALNESINSSSQAHEENQVSVRASSDANAELASKIEELSEKENKSAADKQLLAQYIEQLNGSVEGLNLTYSEEADALSMSSEEMQARIELMKEQEVANASMERLTEILEEQSEVEQKLAETNELREEWNQKLEDGSVKASEHKDAMADLDEQEQVLKETTAELAEQQKITEEQMTASMEAITEATEAGVGNQIIAFEDLSESQQATVESMKSTWEDYKSAATDMFDTLSDEVEITASEMAANLEENQRVIGEWSENIAILAERGVDEGLLNTLREAGPESAGHVNALVSASDEELEHLSAVFSEGGDVATDALSKSLGIEESGIMEAVGHLVSDTEQSLKDEIKSAGFENLGVDVADGLADGIDKGSKNAEKSSKAMADATTKEAQRAFETQSPSRVFRDIGSDVTEGLALGISDGTNRVTQAIQKMFQGVQIDSVNSFNNITKEYDRAVKQIEKTLDKLPKITQKSMRNMLNRLKTGANNNTREMRKLSNDLVRPFGNTSSRFRNIGTSAMNGLNAGLNAGRGRVMATARGIANSVAATMRSSLRIQSPSRVMKDDVGRWIPEGIAEGIEDRAPVVYDALNKLNTSMIRFSTPEAALGMAGMSANAFTATSGYSTNTNTTVNNHSKPTIHIEKIENYSDSDIPKILEESAWIMGREESRLDE